MVHEKKRRRCQDGKMVVRFQMGFVMGKHYRHVVSKLIFVQKECINETICNECVLLINLTFYPLQGSNHLHIPESFSQSFFFFLYHYAVLLFIQIDCLEQKQEQQK